MRLQGGLNTYSYVNGNPVSYSDPLGLFVDAVLDIKLQTLTVTDVDTHQSVVATAFTGGHVNPDGSIVSPGPGAEVSAPIGPYWIVDNPNPTPGHTDWYGVYFEKMIVLTIILQMEDEFEAVSDCMKVVLASVA